MFEQQAACCLSNYLLLEAVHTEMNNVVVLMAQTTTANDNSDVESVINARHALAVSLQ